MKARLIQCALVIIGLAAAAVAWLAGGFLALIVVLVLGVLVISYRWQRQVGGWRSGRPSRQRRLRFDEATAAKLPGRDRPQIDPVEGWVRERTLYDLFDGRGDRSSGSDGNGA